MNDHFSGDSLSMLSNQPIQLHTSERMRKGTFLSLVTCEDKATLLTH